MMYELLCDGQVDKAISYPFRKGVRRVTLDDVCGDGAIEDAQLNCIICSIKSGEGGEPLKYSSHNKSITYDLLLLARELISGGEFYILTKTKEETRRLLCLVREEPVHGQQMTLYEPCFSDEYIFEIPLLDITEPLVSSTSNLAYWKTDEMIIDVGHRLIKSFIIKTSDLKLICCKLLKGCTAKLCDSNHAIYAQCPSEKQHGSYLPKRVLSCLVTVPQEDVRNVSFSSASFTSLFVTPDALQGKVDPTTVPLRESVARTLQFYRSKEIPFLVGGWYERSLETEPKEIHVSFLKPLDVLPMAPVYSRGPEQPPPDLATRPLGRGLVAGHPHGDALHL